jgi:hypothetical protein
VVEVSEAELPEWEKRIREALKPVTPEHEKRIMEALKPTAVEYEERIREAEKQVDEVKRISRELKEEYGVEQKPAKANPIIPAVDWSRMSNSEILTSIEVAARVLKERRLEKEEKRLASLVAKDLVDIAMDPPQVEEAEYEEIRRRAGLAKGEKLLPV